MSKSPTSNANLDDRAEEYLSNWSALGQMVSRGMSFSGRERNRAFLNLGDGRFADVSSAFGLDAIGDGRGIAVTDWDQDGDVDLWMANRTGPRARLMLNETCPGSGYVAFELRGTQCNRDAKCAR